MYFYQCNEMLYSGKKDIRAIMIPVCVKDYDNYMDTLDKLACFLVQQNVSVKLENGKKTVKLKTVFHFMDYFSFQVMMGKYY